MLRRSRTPGNPTPPDWLSARLVGSATIGVPPPAGLRTRQHNQASRVSVSRWTLCRRLLVKGPRKGEMIKRCTGCGSVRHGPFSSPSRCCRANAPLRCLFCWEHSETRPCTTAAPMHHSHALAVGGAQFEAEPAAAGEEVLGRGTSTAFKKLNKKTPPFLDVLLSFKRCLTLVGAAGIGKSSAVRHSLPGGAAGHRCCLKPRGQLEIDRRSARS